MLFCLCHSTLKPVTSLQVRLLCENLYTFFLHLPTFVNIKNRICMLCALFRASYTNSPS